MLMIAALATTLASTRPAQAYPVTVSGWLVAERRDGCAMGSEFAGPGKTYLLLDKRVDGEVYLSITNDTWSAREGKPYDVSYHLNGKEYSEGTTVGYRSGDARGFWSKMGTGFERDFATGKDLSVFLDGEFIRKLSLAGTGAAIAALNRCVAGVRGRAQPELRRKGTQVPKDPFARHSPAPAAKPRS
jgi:hypothetical protein